MTDPKLYEAVVIGVSAGGLSALDKILPRLDKHIPVPVFVVQHLSPDSDNYLPRHFNARSLVTIKEGEDKEMAVPGTVYFAPPNYHLMLEFERTMSLSIDARVNFSRPSVDVLFETAAETYGDKLIGIILTGANSDGSMGLKKIQLFGGLTIVQSPETAKADAMPKAAIKAVAVDYVLPLDEIGDFINMLVMSK